MHNGELAGGGSVAMAVGIRVIPYKSTEKNVKTFFFGFLTKKVKGL